MNHPVDALQGPPDLHQACGVEGNPESLGLVGGHDGVGKACFIFEGQEEEALRRTGPLAHNDVPRGVDRGAIGGTPQFGGGEHAARAQGRAQVRHDLRSWCESRKSVIGQSFFQG